MDGRQHTQAQPAPPGWRLLEAHGPGGFVTLQVWRRPDGLVLALTSRWLRKHSPRLNPRRTALRGPFLDAAFAPRRTTWWIGLLFAIGSACFLVASLPGFAGPAGTLVANLVYFIGSTFFTSAAYLQFFEAVNAGVESAPWVAEAAGDAPPPIVFFAVRVRSLGYWAALVQLVGTVAFNVSTFTATRTWQTAAGYDEAVWRPDAFGSACFLLASYLAWAEVCHSYWQLGARGLSCWIAVINVAGSIAFAVAAVGAWHSHATGRPLEAAVDDLGTLVGAVCFLAGALLLWPEAVLEPVARPVSRNDGGAATA